VNIILFAHPRFIGHQSMPRYTTMLADGMKRRGHNVEVWTPRPRLFNLPASTGLKKWLGYIDQYIIFPQQVRRLIKRQSANTLYVFTDQALGPWVPLVSHLPHVIHCHDFLAQRSAMGNIAENPTSWTGKQYQAYIRRGYSKGKHFISVSNKTKEDLHSFLSSSLLTSKVVYNGLNQEFKPLESSKAKQSLSESLHLNLTSGYLLHVGGNDWYKNRKGVIEIYNAWRRIKSAELPLLLIGASPSADIMQVYEASPYKKDIHFLKGIADDKVRMAYAGASVFLFPSLAEGFGWPIAEAMASGSPVITTNEVPMTEVGGGAAFYIGRMPADIAGVSAWANNAAKVVESVLCLGGKELESVKAAGIQNAKRFDTEHALDQIESIYLDICDGEETQNKAHEYKPIATEIVLQA
jgi:glycosyltransferase involved in cell wall biosynthesis